MNIEELLEEFDFLEDWEERCDFLVDLGFDLPDMAADDKIEENRVYGCQSNVWLKIDVKENTPPTIEIIADSDAMIVKGLISVLLTIYSGKTPEAILQTDVKSIFHQIGLDQHLSTARKNGLNGMVKRVRELAAQNV
jgi:cysteine desulfuration protein SufE